MLCKESKDVLMELGLFSSSLSKNNSFVLASNFSESLFPYNIFLPNTFMVSIKLSKSLFFSFEKDSCCVVTSKRNRIVFFNIYFVQKSHSIGKRGMALFISIGFYDFICSESFLANKSSLLSRLSISSTQQSTGQTAAHCGSS